MEREPVKKMFADGFRETGILIFVFAILDKLVSGTITVRWTGIAFVISGMFFGLGVMIERGRRDE